jgi:hypothetical protein
VPPQASPFPRTPQEAESGWSAETFRPFVESDVASTATTTARDSIPAPTVPSFVRVPGGAARSVPATAAAGETGDAHGAPPTKLDTLVANGDRYATSAGVSLRVAATSGLLANDAGVGASVSVRLVQPPGGGTLMLDTNGGFTYTPRAGFSGPDSFVYELRAPDGRTATATVRLQVDLVGELPRVAGDDAAAGVARAPDLPAPGVATRLDVPVVDSALGQDAEESRIDVTIATVRVTGIAFSVGVVWWALRAGGLLASLLASVPVWRHLDPLPVLGRRHDEGATEGWSRASDADAERDEVAVSVVLGDVPSRPPGSRNAATASGDRAALY